MSHFTVLVIGDHPDKQLAPFQENNMGDCPEEYLKFNEDEEADVDEKNGKRGYWENPNRRWDWYLIGGRWTGAFALKPGKNGKVGKPGVMTGPPPNGFVDQARAGDIDWPKTDAHWQGKLRTLAVIKNGEWFEQGRMRMFANVEGRKPESEWAEQFDLLLAEGITDETLLTLIDCHI